MIYMSYMRRLGKVIRECYTQSVLICDFNEGLDMSMIPMELKILVD
jgi:hypothetical protein